MLSGTKTDDRNQQSRAEWITLTRQVTTLTEAHCNHLSRRRYLLLCSRVGGPVSQSGTEKHCEQVWQWLFHSVSLNIPFPCRVALTDRRMSSQLPKHRTQLPMMGPAQPSRQFSSKPTGAYGPAPCDHSAKPLTVPSCCQHRPSFCLRRRRVADRQSPRRQARPPHAAVSCLPNGSRWHPPK